MDDFDVAVAGGGPAGAAAAITLARQGYRVALADSRPPNRLPLGEALLPTGHSLLDELGVRVQFDAAMHRASFGTVSCWGAAEPRIVDSIYHVAGNGYQLDRTRFDAMLIEAAVDLGVTVFANVHMSLAVAGCQEAYVMRLKGHMAETFINSNWLVDATGRPATLARALGAQQQRLDSLVAAAVLFKAPEEVDQDGRTWVEAVEDGWWYSALLPSGTRLVVFLYDSDLLSGTKLKTQGDVLIQLSKTSHVSRLVEQHAYEPLGRLQGADACTARLTRMAGDHWLAVGDAAISRDPLSSQGLCSGMHLGICAGKAIHAAAGGDGDALAQYERYANQIFQAFIPQWRSVYAQEKRWPSAPFWVRRRSVAWPRMSK